MGEALSSNVRGLPVTVIVGATSKWRADGPNTVFAHGRALPDHRLPFGARWGLGGALAHKFAHEGHFVVLTTRKIENAAGLTASIKDAGGECLALELDVSSESSIAQAFSHVRKT